MVKYAPAVPLAVLLLAGCTTVRVAGMVYDEATGDWINSCGITTGPKYYHTDSAGHYNLKTRADWKSMTFVAPGYETKSIPVDGSKRFANVNVGLVPRASSTRSKP